jgi:hypothetical protein
MGMAQNLKSRSRWIIHQKQCYAIIVIEIAHADVPAAPYIGQLTSPEERRFTERVVLIRVAAFDWNCQQYITPRFTEEQVAKVIAPLRQQLVEVQEENKMLRQKIAALGQQQ